MNFRRIRMALARRNPFLKIGYAKCGKHSLIYKPLLIDKKSGIYLGNYVSFLDGARIDIIDNWLNERYDSKVIIGNNTSFEQNCQITSAGIVKIGENCCFSARVLITNLDHSYSKIGINVLKQEIVVRDVTIGNNCFFGMDSKVFSGVNIGDNVIVGANTIVTHNVPSNCVVVGCPGKIIKKYNFEKAKWEKYE